MLAFKSQNCELTLAEGLEIYLDYLKENEKNIGTDDNNSEYKRFVSNVNKSLASLGGGG